ncbi:hypothetical protein ABT354_13360 [Streptomyces sp. NPDC000594]|uniref:hypothetical protein n=1 Tax=Streptomyces sp. NPDC000594 TaxID=3154261 RepID=UPI00332199C5
MPGARPGDIPVDETPFGEDPSDLPSFRPESDPDCRTVNRTNWGLDATDIIHQTINWKKSIHSSTIRLTSFDGGETERRFARLKTALRSCGTYRGESWAGDYTGSIESQKAPAAGDEAVQYKRSVTFPLNPDDGGTGETMTTSSIVTIVRTGNVIATYGHDKDAFPTALITLQTQRIRNAQRP